MVEKKRDKRKKRERKTEGEREMQRGMEIDSKRYKEIDRVGQKKMGHTDEKGERKRERLTARE